MGEHAAQVETGLEGVLVLDALAQGAVEPLADHRVHRLRDGQLRGDTGRLPVRPGARRLPPQAAQQLLVGRGASADAQDLEHQRDRVRGIALGPRPQVVLQEQGPARQVVFAQELGGELREELFLPGASFQRFLHRRGQRGPHRRQDTDEFGHLAAEPRRGRRGPEQRAGQGERLARHDLRQHREAGTDGPEQQARTLANGPHLDLQQPFPQGGGPLACHRIGDRHGLDGVLGAGRVGPHAQPVQLSLDLLVDRRITARPRGRAQRGQLGVVQAPVLTMDGSGHGRPAHPQMAGPGKPVHHRVDVGRGECDAAGGRRRGDGSVPVVRSLLPALGVVRRPGPDGPDGADTDPGEEPDHSGDGHLREHAPGEVEHGVGRFFVRSEGERRLGHRADQVQPAAGRTQDVGGEGQAAGERGRQQVGDGGEPVRDLLGRAVDHHHRAVLGERGEHGGQQLRQPVRVGMATQELAHGPDVERPGSGPGQRRDLRVRGHRPGPHRRVPPLDRQQSAPGSREVLTVQGVGEVVAEAPGGVAAHVPHAQHGGAAPRPIVGPVAEVDRAALQQLRRVRLHQGTGRLVPGQCLHGLPCLGRDARADGIELESGEPAESVLAGGVVELLEVAHPRPAFGTEPNSLSSHNSGSATR